jgi:hypothetical protein
VLAGSFLFASDVQSPRRRTMLRPPRPWFPLRRGHAITQTGSRNARGRYDQLVSNIDSSSVKLLESGEIVRFPCRVIKREKAKPLHDETNEPSLIDPRAGVRLVLPSLEKVGSWR